MPAPTWYSSWVRSGLVVNDLPVFFIGGCQKSGTTWLQRLLDAHPAVCCGGEGHLADLLAPALQQAMAAYNQRQSQRAAGLAVLFRNEDYLGAVRMLSDRILAGYVAGSPDPRAIRAAGDKTPEHAVNFAALSELYPDARFIHIIRDGRDACVSGWFHLKRQGKAGKFSALPEYASYFAEHHWVRYITAARSAAAGMPGRYLEVKYELLHADPEGETCRLLQFLDVESNDAAVAACVEGGSFERLAGGRKRGEEDASSFFRKGIVGDWRAHFDADAIARFEQKGGALLGELEYEPLPAGVRV
jgi:hypothetical protein